MLSIRKVFPLLLVLATFLLVIGKYSRGAGKDYQPEEITAFIESHKELSSDEKLSLEQFAQYLRNILNEKEFDELRALSCISILSRPHDRHFREIELLVQGKVLNSVAKIRKYYEHEEKFSGKVLTFPEVTRDECLH